MTLGNALRQGRSWLEQGQIAEARAAAEVLLADIVGLHRPALYLYADRPLSAAEWTRYQAYLQRRLRGEPVQYILGHQEFWSLTFEVTPAVLIPRPESELLIEYGLYLVKQWHRAYPSAPLSILDVGTGSGNLAISLAHSLPASHVYGIDCSRKALEVARRNAQCLGVATRTAWICSDLLSALQPATQQFALCVANLPYVTTAEWHSLPAEIREYEPSGALVGGADGLESIRRLIMTLPPFLAPGASMLLEVGWQQAAEVRVLLQRQQAFQAVGVYQDFAGIDRVVWALRHEEEAST